MCIMQTPAMLLLLAALLSLSRVIQACEESGYCSNNSVQPFFGNVFSGKNDRALTFVVPFAK